jgi:dethiobiotin synthetase
VQAQPQPPGLFFTGTDTAVGKTFVAAGVARALRRQGHTIALRKPVATGADPVNGGWLSEDTRRLVEAGGTLEPPELVTRWSFPEPVAPPTAARRHGVSLTLEGLAGAARAGVPPAAALLVEGVGGLLCPLTERETVADLAAVLGLPLVVVARRALGTLNHTLLTLEAARTRGLAVAGLVVNETEPGGGLAWETNVAELRGRGGVPLLTVVPYGSDGAALERVDWWRLCFTRPEGPARSTQGPWHL